jgi:NAD(P)-dependent dehydrogenase (short-subunit alcohol dehydrogenase family)
VEFAMKLSDKVIVVTGGGRGIGAALCRRFAAEGPRGIAVADIDAAAARAVADEVGGLGVACDVGREEDIDRLVAAASERFGRVDVFCSNAGVARGQGFGAGRGGPFASDADWSESWAVNVMAHVYAARAVLAQMLERESGYLVNVASAAGLLTEMGSQAYSVTKHAAVAFSEWLAIAYAEYGIEVSCVCPQGVDTRMVRDSRHGADHLLKTLIPPEAVAECVVAGMEAGIFLILPHPEVREYAVRRASDVDRWLRGMARYRTELYGEKPRG